MICIQKMVLGPVATNCYYVYDSDDNDRKTVVIDPADEGDLIAEKLSEKGLKVSGILLTHGHFDHILGVSLLRGKTGTKVYALYEEKDLLESAELNLSADVGSPCTVSVNDYLKDGDKISFGNLEFAVIATPGHTKGSCCYYLEKENILFSGDTLFEESVGRTDFPTGSAGAIVRSIKEKLFILPDETKVYPGHGDTTIISHEKEYNPYCC